MAIEVTQSKYPLKHLSLRVPWHDSGWKGVVCQNPQLNGACAKLARIAASKVESTELAHAGKSLQDLDRSEWPSCVHERGTFMAPFQLEHEKEHALAKSNKEHYGHFKATKQWFPAYSAGMIPFRWLMLENLPHLRDVYHLDLNEEREPKLGYKSDWLHEASNQRAVMDAFAAHLKEEESLCFFYAKHVPFIETTARVIVGVGRIVKVGNLTEYDRSGAGMRGMVWDRPIQHSIRPAEKDGFLIPYADLLKRAEADPNLDLEDYTVKAPNEYWDEFSYASELVSHDGSIGALLSIDAALTKMQKDLGIATDSQKAWIHTELVRLWKVRGPFPGLGAVLTAMGVSRGNFLAHHLQEKAGDKTDPWALVNKAIEEPVKILPKELQHDLKELKPVWKKMAASRKAYLKLLSRFELTKEQAENLYELEARERNGWTCTDEEILRDPYKIYEATRHDLNGVKLLTIDRGVFPADSIRLKHPLESPSGLESAIDIRRVRAFVIDALENASNHGHTVVPIARMVETIRERALQPTCPVTADILLSRAGEFEPEVVRVSAGDQNSAFQLRRYVTIREEVKKQVEGRIEGQRHSMKVDWEKLLQRKFGLANDPEEIRARKEKSAALKELAESRFSILAGPAGAGKTTVLGLLCSQPQIQEGGILLIAPTGKARVKLQELAATGSNSKALTLAQFLNQHGRYEGSTGRYVQSDNPKISGYGTVIVDESSMLTEDMIGALFDALKGVQRYVFVGDPAQLPPIGAGRPFIDIVTKLRPADHEKSFPRVFKGLAELTIERRQIGNERPDLRLARWFSSSVSSPGEDDIFSDDGNEHATLRFVQWENPEHFHAKLMEVLKDELKLAGVDDISGFNRALGSTTVNNYDYFNSSKPGQPGAVKATEDWQILSPLRGMPFGVGDINRVLHERFRAKFLELASKQWKSIPKPMGAERIVYGDKVMNMRNHRRDGKKVYPEGGLGYLANGEIGVVVGQWKSNGNPKTLKVEFSSQPGFTYDFYSGDFRDEGDAALELAYGLTIHKAQGSQFKLVVLVLPQGHPVLSRELIYTALTRHRARVVIMHQGPRLALKEFASPHRSETAKRMTNLLQACEMLEFPQANSSVFMQKGLIHRTSQGLAVRSKSEVIIADALTNAGVAFEYEKPLTFGKDIRYPDFTIEDEISGRTVYWEHLGMLEREEYRKAWEKKLAWYKRYGVVPLEECVNANAVLVVTSDNTSDGLDSHAIKHLIKKLFSKTGGL